MLRQLVQRGDHLGKILGEFGNVPFGGETENLLVEGRVVGEARTGFSSIGHVR